MEKHIIPVNKYARSGKKISGVKKIVMHYTANPGASASNHEKYFARLSDRYASAHVFIDSKESIQIIPFNEIAYHCNDVQKRNKNGSAYRGVSSIAPNGNLWSLGIELCIEKDGSFHENTIKEAVKVAGELCKTYGLNPQTDIVRHYDVTAKICPKQWVEKPQEFEDFKDKVSEYIGAKEKPKNTPKLTGKRLVVVDYAGREGLNIRKSNSFDSPVVAVAKKGEAFTILEELKDFYRIGSGYITKSSTYVHTKEI